MTLARSSTRWTPWSQPCKPLYLCLTLTPSFDSLRTTTGHSLFSSVIDFSDGMGTWYFRPDEMAALGWKLADIVQGDQGGISAAVSASTSDLLETLESVHPHEVGDIDDVRAVWHRLTESFYSFYRFGAFVEPIQAAAQPFLMDELAGAARHSGLGADDESRIVTDCFSPPDETFASRRLRDLLSLSRRLDSADPGARHAQTVESLERFVTASAGLEADLRSFNSNYRWSSNNYSRAVDIAPKDVLSEILGNVDKSISDAPYSAKLERDLASIVSAQVRSRNARELLTPGLHPYARRILEIHDEFGAALSDRRKEMVMRFIGRMSGLVTRVSQLLAIDEHLVTNLVPEEFEDFLDFPDDFHERLSDRELRFLVYRDDISVLRSSGGEDHSGGDPEPRLFRVDRMREPLVAEGTGPCADLLSELDSRLDLLGSVMDLDALDVVGTPIFWREAVIEGPVTLIRDPLLDTFPDGSILIATSTTPDFVPLMKRARAIVTDWGGHTSHAALTARELGIPCIVGAHGATSRFETGQTARLDFVTGRVW